MVDTKFSTQTIRVRLYFYKLDNKLQLAVPRIIDEMDWVSDVEQLFLCYSLIPTGSILVGLVIGDGSTFKSVNGKTVLTDNLWHCVAIVFDKESAKCYQIF